MWSWWHQQSMDEWKWAAVSMQAMMSILVAMPTYWGDISLFYLRSQPWVLQLGDFQCHLQKRWGHRDDVSKIWPHEDESMLPLCSNLQHRMPGWYSKVIFLCHSAGHTLSFCNWETFNATCQQGEVVMVTTAQYGRMRRGRCIHSTSTHAIGCSEDILRFDWSIFSPFPL